MGQQKTLIALEPVACESSVASFVISRYIVESSYQKMGPICAATGTILKVPTSYVVLLKTPMTVCLDFVIWQTLPLLPHTTTCIPRPT